MNFILGFFWCSILVLMCFYLGSILLLFGFEFVVYSGFYVGFIWVSVFGFYLAFISVLVLVSFGFSSGFILARFGFFVCLFWVHFWALFGFVFGFHMASI